MLVSRTKFFQYQNIFYKKLLKTPYKIQLEVVTIQKVEPTEEFSMDAFVGDSPRTSKFYEFQALYETEIPNRTREKYGLKPLRASGQLDECLQKSLYQMDDYCQGIGNVYEHLSEVGLPNNSKIRQFTANNSCVSDYDEAYTELFTWLKNNASFGLSYGDNLINGLEDYTYLGVCFFHDDIVQERKDHMWNDPDNDEYESMPLYQCYVYVMK